VRTRQSSIALNPGKPRRASTGRQTLAALARATQAELMRRLGHSSNAAALAYMHATQDHSRAIAQALDQHVTDRDR
jgi:hypothetical protein